MVTRAECLIHTYCLFQRAFGYSSEDVQMVIESMASQGKEPTFCMGDDIPLSVLSQKSHLLYDYFKQRFAQVSKPLAELFPVYMFIEICVLMP